MKTRQTSAVAALESVRTAILQQVGERITPDPFTSKDLLASVTMMLPPGSDAAYILSTMLNEMTAAGEIETFQYDKRGTAFVRER